MGIANIFAWLSFIAMCGVLLWLLFMPYLTPENEPDLERVGTGMFWNFLAFGAFVWLGTTSFDWWMPLAVYGATFPVVMLRGAWLDRKRSRRS